jgi:signal transduction histidine kinase
MSRLPIRLRVTVAFAAVMAVVLIAVGLFVYLRLDAQLTESVETALRSRATEVAALARRGSGSLADAARNPLIEQDESFAELVAPDGRVLDATPQLGGASVLDAGQLARAVDGPTLFSLTDVPGLEGEVRVLAAPTESEGRNAIAIVGASLGDHDEAVDGLAQLLLIGGPVALLLASLACYWMVGRALGPVERMRGRAAEISAREPGARLPLPEAHDELFRLGETLNAMLARLEDALARERRFVDDASHELRTPLALHKTELELALRHAHNEAELRTAIESAAEEVDRLITLAERLLVVARSEDGELVLNREPIDIRDVLDAIAARFEARAARAARPLSVAGDTAVVDADRTRVEQALTNLVENALVHGDGPVTIAARQTPTAVEIHVTDAGKGIPAGFIDRAFERFSRAGAARSRGGSGLGLAVVDSIARAHGGSAHARNLAGGGADVWIELPFTAVSLPPRTTEDTTDAT